MKDLDKPHYTFLMFDMDTKLTDICDDLSDIDSGWEVVSHSTSQHGMLVLLREKVNDLLGTNPDDDTKANLEAQGDLDKILAPIQAEYDGGEPMLPGTIPEIKAKLQAYLEEQTLQARIDEVKNCIKLRKKATANHGGKARLMDRIHYLERLAELKKELK